MDGYILKSIRHFGYTGKYIALFQNKYNPEIYEKIIFTIQKDKMCDECKERKKRKIINKYYSKEYLELEMNKSSIFI